MEGIREDESTIPQSWEMPNLSTEELHEIVRTVRHRTFWWEKREEAAWSELVKRGESPSLD